MHSIDWKSKGSTHKGGNGHAPLELLILNLQEQTLFKQASLCMPLHYGQCHVCCILTLQSYGLGPCHWSSAARNMPKVSTSRIERVRAHIPCLIHMLCMDVMRFLHSIHMSLKASNNSLTRSSWTHVHYPSHSPFQR